MWILLFHVLSRFLCVHACCTGTLLQTDGVTHKNQQTPFTRSSLCAQEPLHREDCAHRSFYAQTPLHTGGFFIFTRMSFYTQKFLHTDALHKEVVAGKNKCTPALLHTERLHIGASATNGLHTFFFTQKMKSFDTEKLEHTDQRQNKLHTKLLHAETSQEQFLDTETESCAHGSLYAQPTTLVFAETLYTQMPLPRGTFTHRNLCPQQAFTHSRFFLITQRDSERLLSPSLSPTFRFSPQICFFF